jgi:hypothetical protein
LHFDADIVRAFKAQLVQQTQPLHYLKGTSMDYKAASHLVGRIGGGGCIGMLHLIRGGHLVPYHSTPEMMRLNEACFDRQAVQKLFIDWRNGLFSI